MPILPNDSNPGDVPEYDNLPDAGTICAHLGEDRKLNRGAVTPPIFQNSLFTFPTCEDRGRKWLSPDQDVYDYTRVSNPTTDIAEAKIAALEGGEAARCFGSGMAAISAAIMSCVKAGDHVVAVETGYGPTRQFLSDYLVRFGVSVTYVDGSDVAEWEDAILANTTLFYLESPSSVIFKQQDLRAVASLAKAHGISTICDNSWATPIYQNPLRFGINLVLHSATKYLGGHSDIVAGVVAGSAERIKKLVAEEGCLLGAVLDPFASWLLIRGLRTLPVRMEAHQRSGRHIACALTNHPAVAAVYYPGLPGDRQPELTKSQLRGTSGLLSFELKNPGRDPVYKFCNHLKYFGIGCSWGGFESLCIPSGAPEKSVGGTGNGHRSMVRLHIGLESADDLWDDIESALDSVG
jgi:cystathionine beta-lyase